MRYVPPPPPPIAIRSSAALPRILRSRRRMRRWVLSPSRTRRPFSPRRRDASMREHSGLRGPGSTDVAMADADVVGEAEGGEWEDQQLRKAMSVRAAAPAPKTIPSRGPSGTRRRELFEYPRMTLWRVARARAPRVASLGGVTHGVHNTRRGRRDETRRSVPWRRRRRCSMRTKSVSPRRGEALRVCAGSYGITSGDLCQCLHDKDPHHSGA